MSYLWEVLQNAKVQGIEKNKIRFKKASNVSPYVEVNSEWMNYIDLKEKEEYYFDINVYHRFSSILAGLIEDMMINCEKQYINQKEETQNTIENYGNILNLLLHLLGELDLKAGIHREVLIYENIVKDIDGGIFGREISSGFQSFSKDEKFLLAKYLYKLYRTKEQIKIFQEVIRKIFEDHLLYRKKGREEKYILYISSSILSKKIDYQKLDIIKALFWDISYELEVFWQNHFGVIEHDEIMRIGNIGIY
ncbi:hypothetical protein [Clostridium formicaceticum]|uniref:Uncharacterized protein n=1 Tax=Clostridium formicaceticum TaxID=1497 RepID=A0AAC9WHS0_9CLOT|nr:hypothetical protein [Clostridium formicaceticum]AOY74678.1 hypothetical protein BJL90_01135 [Clostridium formicaceticum]ARE89054.1 hypothetical protein CLFO_34600 [Clostridium formicaceticum]